MIVAADQYLRGWVDAAVIALQKRGISFYMIAYVPGTMSVLFLGAQGYLRGIDWFQALVFVIDALYVGFLLGRVKNLHDADYSEPALRSFSSLRVVMLAPFMSFLRVVLGSISLLLDIAQLTAPEDLVLDIATTGSDLGFFTFLFVLTATPIPPTRRRSAPWVPAHEHRL